MLKRCNKYYNKRDLIGNAMDLRDFYLKNINKDDYYYRVYDSIANDNETKGYSFEDRSVKNCSFVVYDAEEAIQDFRELCQPEVRFDDEKRNWFHLICYYLFKMGYEIKVNIGW